MERYKLHPQAKRLVFCIVIYMPMGDTRLQCVTKDIKDRKIHVCAEPCSQKNFYKTYMYWSSTCISANRKKIELDHEEK